MFLEKNFYLHWINLNSLSFKSIFGEFSEKNLRKWNKGVLEQLLDAMEQNKSHGFFNQGSHRNSMRDSKDIEAFNLEFNSSFISNVANKFDETQQHNKKFSHLDWIVYEITDYVEDNVVNLALEQAIKRKVTLNNGTNLHMNQYINQIIEVKFLFFNFFIIFDK